MWRQTVEHDKNRSGVFGIILATGLWAFVLTIPGAYVSPTTGGIIVIGAWILLPVALFQDICYVRANVHGWDPRYKAYILSAIVPFVGALVGAVYLYRRYENPPS